ncbi:MAG: LUD domain-containing protein [Halobacteriota archaeon]|uniref:LUD domain-containing protein n=1 Tax=Natronomonas sp. TaxID=2184060 RepID=UPI003975D5BC
MSTDLVAQFTDSALETVDSCTRTNVDEFEAALSELVVDPAVGAPLPSDSVSLDGTTVDTEPSVEDFRTAETGVVQAEAGVANYGTISIESRSGGDELVSLYPPRHVVVLDAVDIVPDLKAAFDRFEARVRDARENGGSGASRVLATGPSATADMGELVEGVHGPKEVHILVVDDR